MGWKRSSDRYNLVWTSLSWTGTTFTRPVFPELHPVRPWTLSDTYLFFRVQILEQYQGNRFLLFSSVSINCQLHGRILISIVSWSAVLTVTPTVPVDLKFLNFLNFSVWILSWPHKTLFPLLISSSSKHITWHLAWQGLDLDAPNGWLHVPDNINKAWRIHTLLYCFSICKYLLGSNSSPYFVWCISWAKRPYFLRNLLHSYLVLSVCSI